MKTADLIGPALDREVAKLEGWAQSGEDGFWRRGTHKRAYAPEYSKQWMWGGPVIEREGISSIKQTVDRWTSEYSLGCDRPDHARSWGPTPLIAAMRCYVASRLGDEVDIPKELM